MDEKYRILVVEDEPLILKGIRTSLMAEGYDVLETGDGLQALKYAVDEEYDLALLDVALPGADGWQILKTIQKERPSTPVVMVTARGSEKEKVYGLRAGSDDYIVKPFSILELLARIEAVLRPPPAYSSHATARRRNA